MNDNTTPRMVYWKKAGLIYGLVAGTSHLYGGEHAFSIQEEAAPSCLAPENKHAAENPEDYATTMEAMARTLCDLRYGEGGATEGQVHSLVRQRTQDGNILDERGVKTVWELFETMEASTSPGMTHGVEYEPTDRMFRTTRRWRGVSMRSTSDEPAPPAGQELPEKSQPASSKPAGLHGGLLALPLVLALALCCLPELQEEGALLWGAAEGEPAQEKELDQATQEGESLVG